MIEGARRRECSRARRRFKIGACSWKHTAFTASVARRRRLDVSALPRHKSKCLRLMTDFWFDVFFCRMSGGIRTRSTAFLRNRIPRPAAGRVGSSLLFWPELDLAEWVELATKITAALSLKLFRDLFFPLIAIASVAIRAVSRFVEMPGPDEKVLALTMSTICCKELFG